MNPNNESQVKSKLILIFAAVVIVFALFTCGTRHRDGCKCWDGTNSSATGRGACSHHGGVMYWTHEYWWE